MASKKVTVLLEKKVKNWKMSLKLYGPSRKTWKGEKWPQKTLWSYWDLEQLGPGKEEARGISLTAKKNYWADHSYYSDLEITIYG